MHCGGGWLAQAAPRRRGIRGLLVLGTGLVSAVSLAACGGGSTTVSTKSGSVTLHHHGSSIQYSAPGVSGSVSGGTNVSLPSNFPSAVPRPARGTLVLANAVTAQAASGPSFELIYRYPSANASSAALASYDSALRSAGYVENSSISGSGTVIQGWKSANWGLVITVGPTGSSPASEMMVQVGAPG